jgi:serine phosphatase RsbU (regulator of sigma subunit)
MQFARNVKKSWDEIRWKMLIIFAFFSVLSTILVACFAVLGLNVVVRRESAHVIEERISGMVESGNRLTASLLDRIPGCQMPASNSPLFAEYPGAVWPEAQSLVTVLPQGVTREARPAWLPTGSFAGIVVDRDRLEIRSLRTVERAGCSVTMLLRIPLGESVLESLSRAAALKILSSKAVRLRPYRAQQGMIGEVEANFIPGSRRPVAVVVIARDWLTGRFESWVVCQVRPSYVRTAEDLSRMGLRTASWVFPFGGITVALVLVYGCGLLLSIRLSRRIVAVIDRLSHAAQQVGKGDFSVRIAVPEQDQLGLLASSFNDMTRDLENLREQEKQSAVLERDIVLGHEVQQYLYPRVAPILSAANVSGITRPARIVSGDLYDFLSFSDHEVGLLCADVSGKGVSAALMMAHLQALAHGRLLPGEEIKVRSLPDTFVTALNRDLRGRFGNNRYATLFYGEFDSHSKVLRYINAGHCPPILISEAGQATKLPEGDVPVGLFPEIRYHELRVTLAEGCALVVYTDGVTDALNSQGEEFGDGRLIAFCSSLPKGAKAEAICTLLSSEVNQWSAGVEQFDDTTVLVLSVD